MPSLGTPVILASNVIFGNGPITVALPSAIPSGATVFVVLSNRGALAPASACSDNNSGLAYVRDVATAYTPTNAVANAIWSKYAPSGVASGATFTGTWPVNTSTLKWIFVGYFTEEGIFDRSAFPSASGGATTWSSGATTAIASSGSVAIGCALTSVTANNTNTSGSNPAMVEISESNPGNGCAVVTEAHGIAAGTLVTAAGTFSASGTNGGAVAVYRPAIPPVDSRIIVAP